MYVIIIYVCTYVYYVYVLKLPLYTLQIEDFRNIAIIGRYCI